MASILRVKDDTGKVYDIPALKGAPFTYEDFTEEQLSALVKSITENVLVSANICYVSVAAPTSDVGKEGDICVVAG